MDWHTIQHSVTKLGIGAVVALLNYKLVEQQSFNLITVIITLARKSRWKGMVIILCLCVYVFTKCTENYVGKLWPKLATGRLQILQETKITIGLC